MAGFSCGLPMALLVCSAGIAGELFDNGRGQSLGQVYDPLSSVSQAHCGFFARQTALTATFLAGGAEYALTQLKQSLLSLPPGSISSAGTTPIALAIIRQVANSLDGAFLFFLPIASAFLCADVVIAFIGRLLPNLSLSSEAFLIKSTIGMLVLVVFWQFDPISSVSAYFAGQSQFLPSCEERICG